MTSFRNTLYRFATDEMAEVDNRIQRCNAAFHSPKNPTMTYFGLEVQYETSKDEMTIFFRHQLMNCQAKAVAEQLWESYGNVNFESKYPFVDVIQVLEELDDNTKYVRRVLNLTISGEASSNLSTLKEERLSIQQKRVNVDGSIYFISKSILSDPEHAKPLHFIRRNQTTA